MDFKENVIEWLNGDEYVTVTLNQKRFISKVKKLAEKHSDLVTICHENPDGSIVAHLPLKSVKLNIISNTLSEKERNDRAERMRKKMKID